MIGENSASSASRGGEYVGAGGAGSDSFLWGIAVGKHTLPGLENQHGQDQEGVIGSARVVAVDHVAHRFRTEDASVQTARVQQDFRYQGSQLAPQPQSESFVGLISLDAQFGEYLLPDLSNEASQTSGLHACPRVDVHHFQKRRAPAAQDL